MIDYDKHRVYVEEQDAGLTQNEFRLLSLLGKYAGKVLTYDYMMKEIWGPNMKGDNRILRVNMANIRRKIEKNPGQPQFIFHGLTPFSSIRYAILWVRTLVFLIPLLLK